MDDEPDLDPDSWGSWLPPPTTVPNLSEVTVWETIEEPIGGLWLPGEEWLDVWEERPSFGFARYLD